MDSEMSEVPQFINSTQSVFSTNPNKAKGGWMCVEFEYLALGFLPISTDVQGKDVSFLSPG
jgi:hypothetical protein